MFFLMTSCHKEEIIPNPPGPSPNPFFDIKWFTRIDSTKEIVGTDITQYYKDWMIVTGDLSDPPTLIAFNKKTGKKDWTFVSKGINKLKINKSLIYNNLYIADCSKGFVAINLDQKSIAWEIDLKPISGLTGSGLKIKDGFMYQYSDNFLKIYYNKLYT